MAKVVKLQWTELQREIATKTAEGKTFDELVEIGYTKSLVSKVLNAIKAGQKPKEEQEPRPENQESAPKVPQKLGGQALEADDKRPGAFIKVVPKVTIIGYTPIMRRAQEAAINEMGWPVDMSLEDFLDTVLYHYFRRKGIRLEAYVVEESVKKGG